MVFSDYPSAGEPYRFDVAAALQNYAMIEHYIAGSSAGGQGFFAEEALRTEREARTTPYLDLSAFLFGAVATFEDARIHATLRLSDVRRGLASVAHFYEIGARERTHPARVTQSLATMMLPSTYSFLASQVHRHVRFVRNDVCKSIEDITRCFERAAHPGCVGYHPFLHASTARSQEAKDHLEKQFNQLIALIRNK